MLTAYRIAGWVLHPFAVLWLLWRERKGKEDGARLYERFGKARLARPTGKLCWFHAASVGESQSVLPLIRKMIQADPQLHILLTTGTVSSASLMQKRLPERAMHQFVPIDTPIAIRRFLRHWKPDLAIWVESEFWPNSFHTIDTMGIPRMLINARISERSYSRWQRFRKSFHTLVQPFKHIFCVSTPDQDRFKRLGIERAEYIGNLKYDVEPLPYDTKAMGELVTLMGDRRVWLAASTHRGEEEILLQIHTQLKETYPDLLTIIVPRHPRRSEAIASMVAQHKMTFSVRSKNQRIVPETDIYLADTLGELGLFYRLVGIVAIGGSFVPHGGHNPIEAALLDCAIVCGPHMHNFAEVTQDLSNEAGLVQVQDVPAAVERISRWLSDHFKQEEAAQAAHKAVDERVGAADSLLSHAAPFLGIMLPESSEEGAPDAA